jgi:predicted DNA-binding transcriptional regulator AlpA
MSALTNDPPFMRRDEVKKLHPVTDKARERAEKIGMFPKRIWLAPKVASWRRAEVSDWFADPAAWAERHRGARD